MSKVTVEISETSDAMLRELAKQTGQSIVEVLDKALAAYRREVFFEQMNAGYAELRADPQAWEEFEKDRKEWDGTLMDGLDADERWTQDGKSLPAEPTPLDSN